MDTKTINSDTRSTVRVVTLRDLWEILIHRIWIIMLAVVISVGAVFAFMILTYTPRYDSTATMYILRQANEGVSSNDISSDFSLALKVVNDCDFLLKSDTVVNAVKEKLQLGEEYDNLVKQITTKNPSDTRILQITVQADTPEKAKEIVDTLCEIGAENINKAMGFNQVNLYEYGTISEEPCNKPSLLLYALVGAVVAAAVYSLFVVMFIMDDTLKSDEDCQRYLGVSVIGDIPDANDTHRKKYGYYRGYRGYGYGYKSGYYRHQAQGTDEKEKNK